jgi:hypothetical protein
MAVVNAIITSIFDVALAPFAGHPWAGLIAISLATGGLLLLIFRYTSNQRAIRATKDRILAHLLEVVLYRDQMRVVVRAQARLFVDNLRYLGYALVPLAFMVVPVGLLLVQLDLRYGHRPLRVGERAIVSVKLAPNADLGRVALSAPPGIEVETESLRIPALNEVDWRIRAEETGLHEVQVSVGDQTVSKQITAGRNWARISLARAGRATWQQFLHPGEPPLPADSPVTSITVSYPRADLTLFGRPVHWVWPWLVISMVFGYALKGPLRVNV